LAFDAAKYEAAPDCATGSVSTADCVAGVYGVVGAVARRSYGLVVVTEVDVGTGGRPLGGDIVDASWSVARLSPRDVVAATSWEGRLTAVNLRGQVHHTWQNPYTAWQLLTWLASACALVGFPVTVAYLTRVDIPRQSVVRPRRPWTQRLDTLGIIVFLIVAIAVSSITSSTVRFVFLAVGWAGLSAFLITAGRGTVLAWLEDSERSLRSPAEYVTVTASRMVLAVLVVAFIVVTAGGLTRYALT